MTRHKQRTKITGHRNVLTVNGQDPAYQYRVVNDVGDRVVQLQEIGYEIVTDKTIKVGDRRVAIPTAEGSPVKVSVGKDATGAPLHAYVMRQKKEYYEEDQKAKQDEILKTEKEMKQTARESADYGKLEIS